MTRTHKVTDRDHVGLANGTVAPEEHLPRYFGKSGYADTNPASAKKQGGGKGNWGQPGLSELEDYAYNMTKPRRRTNSTSAAAGHSALKTKFEALDPQEAVFYDEDLHGPSEEDIMFARLEKMSSVSSSAGSSASADTMASVFEEEEEMAMAGNRTEQHDVVSVGVEKK